MDNSQSTPLMKHVLHIEASDLILTWTIPLIQKLGCTVISARTLETATEAIDRNFPLDLVILGDITRPPHAAHTELHLLQKLRSIQAYKKIPILLLTSQPWLNKGKEAGATAQLIKPIGADQLENAILPLLNAAAARKAN